MAEPPSAVVYGYVAVPLLEHRIPYRGRVQAHMIELAWRKVETRIPNWRPGIYRIFVYSLIVEVSEYQSAGVVVKEDGSFELRKL